MRTKDFDEEAVLRKAIDIFWEKGYNATSMHDLIDALGIGRSSIYHAFGDKHTLFVRALELYQSEGTAKITRILDSSPSVKKAVDALLNAVIDDVFSSSCPSGCFKVNTEVEVASQDETVNDLVFKDDLIIEEALNQAFRKGQLNGEIGQAQDTLALARFFCNTISGMRVYAKFRNNRQFFEDIKKIAITILD